MKDYFYRKHIKVIRNFVIITIGILALLFWFLVFASSFILKELQFFLIFMAILMTGEVIFAWIFMGRFTKVKISIDDTQLIYTNFKGETQIPFEDIQGIKISTIRYLGGWIKIKSKEKTIRLTVVVKDIGELLLLIKKGLDNHGHSHLYKDEIFLRFLRTSIYSDESWDRVYGLWWKLIIFSIMSVFFAIIIGTFLQLSYSQIFLMTVISALYPTVVYILTEIPFMKRISKLMSEFTDVIPQRDISYEKLVYKNAMIFSPGVYVLIIVLIILLK